MSLAAKVPTADDFSAPDGGATASRYLAAGTEKGNVDLVERIFAKTLPRKPLPPVIKMRSMSATLSRR